ncbi:MAG: LysM peptidoglycan-binding domain-containing protein [Phage NG54]|nr:MAG: LysM peptidoglycan-binding domain-containing protein [Phage NG54]
MALFVSWCWRKTVNVYPEYPLWGFDGMNISNAIFIMQ